MSAPYAECDLDAIVENFVPDTLASRVVRDYLSTAVELLQASALLYLPNVPEASSTASGATPTGAAWEEAAAPVGHHVP